jgi:hypothetical protein
MRFSIVFVRVAFVRLHDILLKLLGNFDCFSEVIIRQGNIGLGSELSCSPDRVPDLSAVQVVSRQSTDFGLELVVLGARTLLFEVLDEVAPYLGSATLVYGWVV